MPYGYAVQWSASVADNSTVNTTIIQAEIAALAARGGGVLNFAPGIHITGPLTLAENITLTGPGATLIAPSGGTVITSTGLSNAVIREIAIAGLNNNTATYSCGVKVTSGQILIDHVVFNNFNDEAVWLAPSSIACKITNCYAGNSAMNYGRTTRTGVFRIEGTDHQIFNNEIGSAQNWLPPVTSPGAGWNYITSANLYNCGYFITAANSFFLMNRAQNVDVGWWVDSTSQGMHRFSDNRGDLCWAHSFVNEAGNSVISNHFAQDVSLQGTGLYSAVKTSGQGNRYSNCHGSQVNRGYGPTYAITFPSYAYEDLVSAGNVNQKNSYNNCQGAFSVAMASTNAWEGSSFKDPNLSLRLTTVGAVNANGTSMLVCAHSTGGEITDFLGDTNGKELILLPAPGAAAVTVANNGRIHTKTGSAISLVSGVPVRFIAYNGVWYQSSDASAAVATSSSGGLPAYLGQVATRCAFNTGRVTGSTQGMFKEGHFARDNITALTLRWDDRYSMSELASGASTTIECAVEYPSGTYTRVTFSGVNQGVMVSGGSILSDSTTVAIPNGALFWLRTWKSNPNGMLGTDANPRVTTVLGDASETGTTVTNRVMGGTISSNATYLSTPSAILGMTQRPSVLLVGDSRVVGLQDLPASSRSGDSGEVARSIGGNFGYICTAMSGESAQGFWGQGNVRRSLRQYVSHVICNFGINDLHSGGFTLANMQTLYPNIWAGLGAPAFPVYQLTLPPVTTSTDGWTTVANQTVAGYEAIRVSVNNWIRTQGDIQLAGIFDITLALESARDSGKWLPGYVNDGIHENATAANAIVSSGAINPALIVRRP